MTDDIRVKPDVLEDTGRSLRYVATEFANAGDISDEYSAIVGHAGLASRLREFADNWNDKRSEMVEAIQGLGEATEGVGSSFTEADNQMYDALMGQDG